MRIVLRRYKQKAIVSIAVDALHPNREDVELRVSGKYIRSLPTTFQMQSSTPLPVLEHTGFRQEVVVG